MVKYQLTKKLKLMGKDKFYWRIDNLTQYHNRKKMISRN